MNWGGGVIVTCNVYTGASASLLILQQKYLMSTPPFITLRHQKASFFERDRRGRNGINPCERNLVSRKFSAMYSRPQEPARARAIFYAQRTQCKRRRSARFPWGKRTWGPIILQQGPHMGSPTWDYYKNIRGKAMYGVRYKGFACERFSRSG